MNAEEFEQLAVGAPDTVMLECVAGRLVAKPTRDDAHLEFLYWLSRKCRLHLPHLRFHGRTQLRSGALLSDRVYPDAVLVTPRFSRDLNGWSDPSGVLLVAELASPDCALDRDHGARKREAYAAAGVPVCLVIHRFSACVTVYSGPGDSGYRQMVSVAYGETVELPEPVGLVLNTASLADIDETSVRTEPWTIEELIGVPGKPWCRSELIGGGLLTHPVEGLAHQRAAQRVRTFLQRAAEAAEAPVAALGPVNIAWPDGLLVPDAAVVEAEAAEAAGVTVKAARVLAVVEVVSSSTQVTDRLLKPALYAAAGIVRYWRVELEPAPRIYAATLDGAAYRTPTVAHAGAEHVLDMGFPVTLDPASLAARRR